MSVDRREFLTSSALAAGLAALGVTDIDAAATDTAATDSAAAAAQRGAAGPSSTATGAAAGPISGAMRPQQNAHRQAIDLSGIWQFQLDPDDSGERRGWPADGLPSPRAIPVPCSWNDLFDDVKEYLGPAWYVLDTWVPAAWNGQRVCLRVGSANYAARVWINGTLAGAHEGGHLPFAFDITPLVRWDRATRIAIQVENLQKVERVPPGPPPGSGGFVSAYPATTYDFFPYAGLQRQVWLYALPPVHVTALGVQTSIQGGDGVVSVKVTASGGWSGHANVSITPARPEGADGSSGPAAAAGAAAAGAVAQAPMPAPAAIEMPVTVTNGTGSVTLRVPGARFWSPRQPYLYPLTVTLRDRTRVIDSYTLQIGIRTVSIDRDRLLLNGEPLHLTGFGRHEDFAIHGRGFNLPVLVRDHELLKWVGANSYRTSHYPYSEEAMDLADRQGILIIDEIPAVGLGFVDGEANIGKRLAQAETQLRDLIARDAHHPSVILWSVANEPMAQSPLGPGAANPEVVAAGVAFFKRLIGLAKELDPTRPATLVGIMGGPPEWLALADVTCINLYFGWYVQGGQLEQASKVLSGQLNDLHTRLGKPLIITEFGADTMAGLHSEPAEMWTEEYQASMLTMYLDVAAKHPFVVGLHVWNFADFKTGQGIIRAGGLNLKGVFTRDRRPKLAAHTLRARWRKDADA
jgi:beta-glucuronidase